MLFILEMKIFLETVTYTCHSILKLQDQSGDREVARAIEVGAGQGVNLEKGSTIKLRNLFLKKLSFLLYNIATLRKNEISTLCNITTLVPNVANLATQI